MPMLNANCKSPTPLTAIQTSQELLKWDLPDAPLDLYPLTTFLRSRSASIQKRRSNLKVDENRILGSRIDLAEARRYSLTETLEFNEDQLRALDQPSTSSITSSHLLQPPLTRKGQSESPGPSRFEQTSASPAPSANPRPKIKIKRDPDRERSVSLAANGSTSFAGDESNDGAGTSRIGNDSFEVDWDEEAPSRPARIYQAKRKRQRTSMNRDHDDASISDFESPQPSVVSQKLSPSRDMHRSGHVSGTSMMKLKLNPTTHTVPSRNDKMTGALRRASLLRSRDDFQIPMTPMQASQAAMWELPKRTPDSLIPKLALAKVIRSYPTRPEEVDVDFAKMDWRERDKERDRLEAAAALAASNGLMPGQSLAKETYSKGKDKKQDQVAHHTFQQWVDGWFRTLTEEDLAWLSSKPDELESFQFPPLGRHYSEVWEEEESTGVFIPTVYLPGGNAVGSATAVTTAVPAPSIMPHNGIASRTIGSSVPSHNDVVNKNLHDNSNVFGEASNFDPRNLKDDHLYGGSTEEARSGPFTERLLAALLPVPPPSSTDSDLSPSSRTNGYLARSSSSPPTTNGDTNGMVIINGGQSHQHNPSQHSNHHSHLFGNPKPQEMSEFEERLRRELKAIDILGEDKIEWNERADDEISSTLRKVQRLLRKQIRINEMRKTRLFQIAMDRMAYQDYLGCLNSVEREIESGWLRRQTQIRKSMQAQKKKKGSSTSTNASSSSSSTTPAILVNGPVAAVIASEGGQNTASPSTPGATGMAQSISSMGTERGGGPIAPQFSEALISAMKKREQLRYAFEPLFAGKPLAKSTPKIDESIYADLDLS